MVFERISQNLAHGFAPAFALQIDTTLWVAIGRVPREEELPPLGGLVGDFVVRIEVTRGYRAIRHFHSTSGCRTGTRHNVKWNREALPLQWT